MNARNSHKRCTYTNQLSLSDYSQSQIFRGSMMNTMSSLSKSMPGGRKNQNVLFSTFTPQNEHRSGLYAKTGRINKLFERYYPACTKTTVTYLHDVLTPYCNCAYYNGTLIKFHPHSTLGVWRRLISYGCITVKMLST